MVGSKKKELDADLASIYYMKAAFGMGYAVCDTQVSLASLRVWLMQVIATATGDLPTATQTHGLQPDHMKHDTAFKYWS